MHFKRIRKLLNMGVCITAAGMIAISTPVLAEDPGITADAQTETVSETTPETQAPETQAPETQAPETQAPETQAPETQAPETQAPETQAPETQASETQVPETQAPETQAPEIQAPETQAEPPSQEAQTEPASPDASQTGLDPEDQDTGTEKAETGQMEKDKEDAKAETNANEAEGDAGQSYYSPYSSNSELLAHQNIVSVSKFYRPMFTHVEADTVILKAGTLIHGEKSADSKQVGIAREMCLAAIIADKEDEWAYVESGQVRGFVNKENIIYGKASELILSRMAANPQAAADELVPYYENEAFLYTMETTRQVNADKVCALASGDVSVYDSKDFRTATVVGKLPKNAIAYILADEDGKVFVESGTVRGFVDKNLLITGHMADAAENVMKGSVPVAEELVKPGDNKAYYYTLNYVEEPDPNMRLRAAIVDFALQFVGNPYVWGGTSLTNGADCSGFVQSIYANFGYSLPRVACDQAVYGKQITIDSAQPGDLIFYARNGYVYHVSMYIGDGRVVQAYSTAAGIITSDIGGNAVWATTLL